MTITIWIMSLSIFSISLAKNADKLTGGTRIRIEDYPHYASVRHRGHHICGGSIITPSHILTSASCVVYESMVVTGNLQVLIGSTSIFSDEPSSSLHEISFIIYHEDYSARNYWIHDIAILKLESPIFFSSIRSKIDLPDRRISARSIVRVIGWNEFLIPQNSEAKYLHMVSMKINSYAECHQIIQDNPGVHFYYHACASTILSNEAITLGDSGGAVIYKSQVVGVISVQIPISRGKSPVLITKVFDYIEWINKIIDKV
ncbi:snake venom serine protease CL2-like [Aphidius gifuensis]|uniref:snake venom serine protease CL2-like n=1 Tax=Aphidius gifuensis TaxID=684658 RepID=UPI001CDC4373|nr:snake venom serine protease CL2-like [Aphidius gifuensis]XP_044015399.1 snake venom serine protease CL2-like [Aphidius gifuensis]